MAWTEEKPFAELQQLLNHLQVVGACPHVVCRGQGAEYDEGRARSSLDRACGEMGDNQKVSVEVEMAQGFRQYAPNYLPFAELQHLGNGPSFWMLMQHYGTPTRLVDWTTSVWMAAYFAAKDEPAKDGIIWVFNRTALSLYAHEKYGNETQDVTKIDPGTGLPIMIGKRYEPWVCPLWQFGHRIPRMIAQRGCFTVAGQYGVDHIEGIDKLLPDSKGGELKRAIRIDRAVKPGLLRTLHQMGIDGCTMFPGIDGVGRMLAERIMAGVV
jgi:hypothetical protein